MYTAGQPVLCLSIVSYLDGVHASLTLSWATEQYCATGAILKSLYLSKQLTLCSQQPIDQLFPGHIVQVVC